VAPFVAGKNAVINGGFDIAQRGTTTGTMASTYILDRWVAQTSSNVGTQAQVAGLTVGTGVFRYGWKFTGLGAYSFMQMGQQIEFANCSQLQNQTVTISFYAQANNTNAASTALIVRTRTIAGVDGSCIFSGANSDTARTISTTAARYSVTKSLPATFGSLSLEFVLGNAGVAGDGFTISGVQLELGSQATPFARAGGSIGGELALCQRYYEKTYDIATAIGSSDQNGSFGFCGGTNSATATFFTYAPVFKVTKRTIPTITIYDLVGNSGTVAKVSAIDLSFVNNQSATVDRIGQSQFRIYSPLGTAAGFYGHFVASAEL
jgi:hypothetical protein